MSNATSLWSRLAGLVSTPLAPSHYLELVSPLAASHARKARVEAVIDEAPGVRTLVLRPGRGWKAHRAGQHARVGVEIDGRIVTRTYSLSSAPERRDGCVTITVKAQGRASTALVRDVAPGAYVTLGLPEGDFLEPGPGVPALFVTAGSGITPIASMLRSLAARGALVDVVHVHYARTAADEIFGDELRALAEAEPGYRLAIVHRPDDGERFSVARLDERVPDWRAREAWACGPRGLLDDVLACFEAEGRSAALHVERFAAALAPVRSATGGLVRFGKSRTSAISDGKTPLLHIAEAAGVHAPHGCRMGICHGCDAKMASGCVRDLRTGQLVDEPGARIQICVSAAAGDVEIDL